MKKYLLAALAICIALAFPKQARAQRAEQLLAEGWKFIREDVGIGAGTSRWETVTVPHTWNAFDAQDGKAAQPDLPFGYYRGACWYSRTIEVPPEWRGRRVFLNFEAASVAAKVWLNGILLGEHRGAFTGFSFELTPHLKFDEPNELRVRVDNSRDEAIPPLSGDFNLYGGIYRSVRLVVTDNVCITPLEYASPGVFVRQKELDEKLARIEVESLISSNVVPSTEAVIAIEVRDADGLVVAQGETAVALVPAQVRSVRQALEIKQPKRWQGRKNPYLYRVVVSVRRDGRVVDAVSQSLGLRTVEITPDRGFLLNGERYPIYGVNRHQDLQDKGWALSPADHERDLAIIAEMGATAVRLAHYPQAIKVYETADRLGLLLWNEVSLVNNAPATAEFALNAEQQLREMILQRVNHPSVMCWGLFNELKGPDAKAGLPLIRQLNAIAKSLDPSRPTVSASNLMSLQEIHFVPDWIAFNAYPGWYGNLATDTMAQFLTKRQTELNGKRLALAEYGAGGSIQHHEEGEVKRPETKGSWHPEEWQALVHEWDWRDIHTHESLLWGTYVWAMFDFAAESRNEGDASGINDKGLVTRDRATKKDAFFFYKANWTAEPLVYVTSRRLTQREHANTVVKVYSNCEEVELFVNEQSLGVSKPDDIRIARWPNVNLQPGLNRVVAVGRSGNAEVRDTCEWTLGVVGQTTAPSAATK